MFKHISFFTRKRIPEVVNIIDSLAKYLRDKNIKVTSDLEKTSKKPDLIIAVGGDGTLLNATTSYINYQIPVLGINLGRLGFLTDIKPDILYPSIDEVLLGKFTLEQRELLECIITDKKNNIVLQEVALNDVSVYKSNMPKMLEFEIYIDDSFVSSQSSDGVIIATPTGSTAYSLSNGGPIIHPAVSSLSIVSICAHTLSNRPLVIDNNCKIMVKLAPKNVSQVSLDGKPYFITPKQSVVAVTKYPAKLNLIHLDNYDYFDVIRTKLKWNSRL